MVINVPARRAAEIAIGSLGCGYDISNDLSFNYCKGSCLIKIDEDEDEIVLPGGITLSNVSKSIKRYNGWRKRITSDVLSFPQMSEFFNHEISLTGEIPSGQFNSLYDFSGCWKIDEANTKNLAFDWEFISLYTVALEKSQKVLRDHVREAVPASWDPAALARFIGTYGTHIIVGVTIGGKDVICMKQQHSSALLPADVKKKLKDMANKRFIDTNGQYSTSSQHMFKNDEDIVTICTRKGGSGVRNLSHNEWLETVQSEPDVISMSFIPITSLLDGVPGCSILLQAIDLYLICRPPIEEPIEELVRFFEAMLPGQLNRKEVSASKWSNFPKDVDREILCNVGSNDRVRFGVVCKTWSKVMSITKSSIPEMNLPWLLPLIGSWGYSFSPENYQLYNPWGRETFSMTTEFSSEFEVLAVKSKWILLEMSQSRFYYFNPYSKRRVKVPPLWSSNETRQYKATFTVSDTSEFCFFLIEDDPNSNGVIVRVRSNCAEKRLNEEKCLDVGLRDVNFQEIIHLVADEEKLFVIFYNRSVGLFSHSDWSHSDWSILIEAEHIPEELSIERPDYVFCEGDLFRVDKSWKIYILGRTEKKWIQYDFGCSDKVIFLSRTFSRFALMIRTEQSTESMSGRIYHFRGGDGDEDWCYVYDPSDGARRSFPWPHRLHVPIWIASPT